MTLIKDNNDFLEDEGSFFRNQHNIIKENISNEEYKQFCDIKNDSERVEFIYNLDIFHKIDLPKNPFGKSSEKSTALKNQGNTHFGKGNYNIALKIYNQALIQCPVQDGILCSTLFANRSACFYYLNEFLFSLTDIKLCLELSYPENLEHKVLERRARCHLALNDLKNALNDFKKALIKLEKSNLSFENRQKKEHDFSLMICMLNKTLSEKIPSKKSLGTKLELPRVPSLSQGHNMRYENASKLVNITETAQEGRFAIAESKIEPGDVLVVENSFCNNLLYEFSKTHCQHCFIRVIYLLACPSCPNVVFCSEKCRNMALKSYHKYECNFLGALWTAGSSIVCNLAVRLLTQKGFNYFINLRPKLDQALPEKYDTSDYRTVYNLCRHEQSRTHLDFFQRSIMAAVLLKFLKNSDFFSANDNILTTDQLFIGSLLLRNLQILQFNAHEIAELQFNPDFPQDIEKSRSQFIGGGLYATLALFNHSCEPGIVRYFSGSKVIVRAVKNIEKGEIIAENYGPIYTEIPKTERKSELKLRYWFDCNCLPCVQNWPIFDNMKTDILPFKCLNNNINCDGVALVNLNTEEFVFQCPKCAQQIFIFGSLKALNDTEAMFKKGENFLTNNFYQDALNVFINIMKLLNNTLKPPYKDFCLCQQKIRTAMLTFGNIYRPNKM